MNPTFACRLSSLCTPEELPRSWLAHVDYGAPLSQDIALAALEISPPALSLARNTKYFHELLEDAQKLKISTLVWPLWNDHESVEELDRNMVEFSLRRHGVSVMKNKLVVPTNVSRQSSAIVNMEEVRLIDPAIHFALNPGALAAEGQWATAWRKEWVWNPLPPIVYLTDYSEDGYCLPLSGGEVDWVQLFNRLGGKTYKGSFCFDYLPRDGAGTIDWELVSVFIYSFSKMSNEAI